MPSLINATGPMTCRSCKEERFNAANCFIFQEQMSNITFDLTITDHLNNSSI